MDWFLYNTSTLSIQSTTYTSCLIVTHLHKHFFMFFVFSAVYLTFTHIQQLVVNFLPKDVSHADWRRQGSIGRLANRSTSWATATLAVAMMPWLTQVSTGWLSHSSIVCSVPGPRTANVYWCRHNLSVGMDQERGRSATPGWSSSL